MEDKQLLRLAAKAAGIEEIVPVGFYVAQPGHYEGGFIVRNNKGGDSCWNPLTDDGDAMRMAVKLGMDIACLEGGAAVYIARANVASLENGEPTEATRRAIVRAAAEFGKSLPSK